MGKTKGIYIPVAIAEEVESWVTETNGSKDTERNQCDERAIIRMYAKTNRAENRNPNRALRIYRKDMPES